MPKPEISAVQKGDYRVEYRARTWGSWIVQFLLVVCAGFIGHSIGVNQGTSIGLAACAAGDSVSVDPAVEGGID